jgi:hypothetical protein
MEISDSSCPRAALSPPRDALKMPRNDRAPPRDAVRMPGGWDFLEWRRDARGRDVAGGLLRGDVWCVG